MNKNLSRKVVLRFAWQGFPYEIGRPIRTGPIYSDLLFVNAISILSPLDRDPSVKEAEGGGLLSTRSSGHTRKGEIRATKKKGQGEGDRGIRLFFFFLHPAYLGIPAMSPNTSQTSWERARPPR